MKIYNSREGISLRHCLKNISKAKLLYHMATRQDGLQFGQPCEAKKKLSSARKIYSFVVQWLRNVHIRKICRHILGGCDGVKETLSEIIMQWHNSLPKDVVRLVISYLDIGPKNYTYDIWVLLHTLFGPYFFVLKWSLIQKPFFQLYDMKAFGSETFWVLFYSHINSYKLDKTPRPKVATS